MRVILALSCPSVIGDQPIGPLLGRLEKTVEIWNQLKVDTSDDLIIIVSGGNGSGKRKFPSSLIMKNYLIEKGIPNGNIFEDNQATTTIENIINCNQILNQLINNGFGVNSLHVVTSDFHIPRVKLIMNLFFNLRMEKIFHGTEKYHSIDDLVKYYINEEIAIDNLLKDKVQADIENRIENK